MKKLITIMLSFALIFGLSACGEKVASPTEVTNAFLTAVKEQDKEKMAELYTGDEFDFSDASLDGLLGDETANEDQDETSDDSAYDEMSQTLTEKILAFDYEVSNEVITDDKATVDVKITTYPLGEALTSFMAEYISQAFFLAFSEDSDEKIEALASTIMMKELNALTEKTFEKTVTVELIMKDDNWSLEGIEKNDEFVDAITGGIYDAVNNLNNIWGDEQSE